MFQKHVKYEVFRSHLLESVSCILLLFGHVLQECPCHPVQMSP